MCSGQEVPCASAACAWPVAATADPPTPPHPASRRCHPPTHARDAPPAMYLSGSARKALASWGVFSRMPSNSGGWGDVGACAGWAERKGGAVLVPRRMQSTFDTPPAPAQAHTPLRAYVRQWWMLWGKECSVHMGAWRSGGSREAPGGGGGGGAEAARAASRSSPAAPPLTIVLSEAGDDHLRVALRAQSAWGGAKIQSGGDRLAYYRFQIKESHPPPPQRTPPTHLPPPHT